MANLNENIFHNHYAFQSGATGAQGATGMGNFNWAFARDTQNFLILDKGILYTYPSANRLADQSGTYGAALIGMQGVTGIAPLGGNVGDSATIAAMLGGIANQALTLNGSTGTAGTFAKFTSGNSLGDSNLHEIGSAISLNASQDGPTIVQVYNGDDTVSSSSSVVLTIQDADHSGFNVGSLSLSSPHYTDDTTNTNRLSLETSRYTNGLNIKNNATGTSDISFYQGGEVAFKQTGGYTGTNYFEKPMGIGRTNPETSLHIGQDYRNYILGTTGRLGAPYVYTGTAGNAAITYTYSTATPPPPQYSTVTGMYDPGLVIIQARQYLVDNKFVLQYPRTFGTQYIYADLMETGTNGSIVNFYRSNTPL